MRPLPPPYDRIAAGEPAEIDLAGVALLSHRLLTKELAFTADERDAFELRGLLPARVLTLREQLDLELEHVRRKADSLERYIGLAALQDRNATLFYRLLAEHLEEFLPIVYTPTVGEAGQQFSHILRRTRGIWVTPADIDRLPELLRNGPYEDVRLMVVTDNERILGLGDLGAGGMAIPVGKLALYTAAGGIHPAITLPVSIDAGTDNQRLLEDPLYVGYRAPRLRGAEYEALIEAFVRGVEEVFPGCVIQWEDFKQRNAFAVLDRYRSQVPSFNDDIQGTAAVVLAGLLAAMRAVSADLAAQRVLVVGAGAAGIGIARLLDLAVPDESGRREPELAMVDSHGVVHDRREDLDHLKRPFALPAEALPAEALRGRLEDIIRAFRPSVMIGATGVGGTFDEAAIRALAEVSERPIIFALSNPTSSAEAVPQDCVRWSEGRALVATGSPFPSVEVEGRRRVIGQANNVFVFPGLGLGAVAVGARQVSDGMLLRAAEVVAEAVSPGRLREGAIYPSVADLRSVSHAVAVAIGCEAVRSGLAALADEAEEQAEVEAAVDAATWWPDYVPYRRAHAAATSPPRQSR